MNQARKNQFIISLFSLLISSTTGENYFAECKIVCRVHFIGHSAKAVFAESQTQRHSAKKCRRQIYLCRVPGTRQRLAVGKNLPLPSAGRSAKIGRRQKKFAECRALGKFRPSAKVAGVMAATCRQPLPSAPPFGARQRIFFIFLILCRVPCALALGNTRQIIFFVFFVPFFLWGLATVIISPFQNLGQF